MTERGDARMVKASFPGFRPILPVEPRPGAWYNPGQKGRGASAVCGATRTGPTSIAATLALPIDSPPARGVQRKLPLVAFLWSPRTVSFPDGKEMGLDCAGRFQRTRQRKTDCHVALLLAMTGSPADASSPCWGARYGVFIIAHSPRKVQRGP